MGLPSPLPAVVLRVGGEEEAQQQQMPSCRDANTASWAAATKGSNASNKSLFSGGGWWLAPTEVDKVQLLLLVLNRFSFQGDIDRINWSLINPLMNILLRKIHDALNVQNSSQMWLLN